MELGKKKKKRRRQYRERDIIKETKYEKFIKLIEIYGIKVMRILASSLR